MDLARSMLKERRTRVHEPRDAAEASLQKRCRCGRGTKDLPNVLESLSHCLKEGERINDVKWRELVPVSCCTHALAGALTLELKYEAVAGHVSVLLSHTLPDPTMERSQDPPHLLNQWSCRGIPLTPPSPGEGSSHSPGDSLHPRAAASLPHLGRF